MPEAKTDSALAYGVHSEVGKLRKVLVCAPGLAHSRLTPSNCDELLFDDVLWVQNAKRDHFDFMSKMRDRGVEVVELHEVLAEIMENPEAKSWLLDRKIIANEVGPGFVSDTRLLHVLRGGRDRLGFLRHLAIGENLDLVGILGCLMVGIGIFSDDDVDIGGHLANVVAGGCGV